MMLNKFLMIMAIAQLVIAQKIRENLTPKDWVKVLLITESKGMLYYAFENDKIARVCIAYRVPEINEKVDLLIPEKEEGNILWVAMMVSLSGDNSWVKTEMTDFFDRFKDIDVIAYENEEKKIIKLTRPKVLQEAS